MAKKKTAVPEDLTADAQSSFVLGLSNAYLACRQQHDVPPFAFARNGRLPAGIRAIGPYPDGSYEIVRTCRRCLKELRYDTDTTGRIVSYRPRTRYPRGFLAKGIGRIPRVLAYDEGFLRVSDVLYATAAPAEQE